MVTTYARTRLAVHVGCVGLALLPVLTAGAADAPWREPRRAAWVRSGPAQAGDVVLVAEDRPAPAIVLPAGEASNVRRAAEFLAGDIEHLTGIRPEIVDRPPPDGARIEVQTAEPGSDPRWEAYSVVVGGGKIVIRGSNPCGTAFGVYELCERLGIDPLHHWTGHTPPETVPLIVRALQFEQGPPAVRFRGLFHDDEDILPRPKSNRRSYARNVPRMIGTVPMEWYERYFETALRLRLNMVAPWVRTVRRFEVQKTASDWGLYYTSHHYDTLLSDPWHFRYGDLAARRGVRQEWDWYTNREGMIKFWRGGVEENKSVNCIWPIGMRGMDDYGYKFPAGWTEDRKIGSFNQAFQIQVDLVKQLLPADQERLYHFTMYTEMLPLSLTGKLKVPQGVIIVWPDDNDGHMRALPEKPGSHKHGVYYHLAYYGRRITKQTHQVVPLTRIEKEFRAILAAGATEYCKVNVSELREYVLGTRFIADICWNGPAAFAEPDAAGRYLDWWCREYFGEGAAPQAVRAYQAYFDLMPEAHLFGYGASKVLGAIPTLRKKFRGEEFVPARPETLPTLQQRYAAHKRLLSLLHAARAGIPEGEAQTFFFENLELAAAIDRLPTEAAILLVRAIAEPDRDQALRLCLEALPPLDELERALFRAERWPFDTWYRPTWVRERNRKLWGHREELIKLLREFVESPE